MAYPSPAVPSAVAAALAGRIAGAVPVIETDRLRLRCAGLADFPAYEAFWASDRSRGMGGPHGSERAWFWFCHDVAQWSLFGFGGLMIDRRDDGATVGEVVLSHGPLFPEAELGWFLFDGYEGHGYITEAAGAVRDWAFGVLGLETLVSYVEPSNLASARVARRLGAVIDADATGCDPDDLVYRHPRPPVAA